MKVPLRMPFNRSLHSGDKSDYSNYSNTKIITLFQVPHYEHLQILICNGNSLTTLAGVEHIKHLWKLDVGNNQIRSLQHLSRFIALGSLILSNNRLQWIELQHIRHMFILDLRLDGNTILDADLNYRQHVLDSLPRIWMHDGVFIATSERNEVDEFFTQSSYTVKPVRRKLARDIFMPTNLKDRSINGLFGPKTTELFAKFPMNCFVNSDLDKKRIKHLASMFQDILLTEMRYDDTKTPDEFLIENRHVLFHLIDIRQNHVEEFNMFLILLLTDLLFEIPVDFLNDIFDVTHIKTIGHIHLDQIFSSSEELRCLIAALIHACARLDRDENHPSVFYEKLFSNLSILINNQFRQLARSNQVYPNASVVSEAKAMLCLEVMQVFIICPMFYTLVDNPNINAIVRQALERSPAYDSVKEVLENLKTDEKSAEEHADLLSPVLGNILKMTIRTLSTKKTKKLPEPPASDHDHSKQTSASSPKPPPARSQSHRQPNIGDRILTAPQTFARIVTIPDADTVMVQFDNILAVNGSMIAHGSLNDHTNYISMNNFEWDAVHEYWKPKFSTGDKITLHMTTTKEEASRNVLPPPVIPRALPVRATETGRTAPKLFEINLNKPKEAFLDHEDVTPTIETKALAPEDPTLGHPMSVRIIKQNKEPRSPSPVLIESTLVLIPDQIPHANPLSDDANLNTSSVLNDFEYSSATHRRSATHRVHVPVHNASQWFNGPNMQGERSGRLEKVVSSLVRRSFRPMSNYAVPRVPTLTSPSSKEHAQSKGYRPGTLQDFCIESQRVIPTPILFPRQAQSAARSYDFSPAKFRFKSIFNQPCPTPSWM